MEKHWVPRGCDPPCRATEGVLHPWSIPWPRRALHPRQFLLLTHHIRNFPQNIGLFPQQVRVSPQTQVFPQQICASPCFPSENLPFPSADPRLSSVDPYFSWDLHLTRVDPHLPSAEPRFPLARPLGTIPGATLAALHPHGRSPEGPQPPVPPPHPATTIATRLNFCSRRQSAGGKRAPSETPRGRRAAPPPPLPRPLLPGDGHAGRSPAGAVTVRTTRKTAAFPTRYPSPSVSGTSAAGLRHHGAAAALGWLCQKNPAGVVPWLFFQVEKGGNVVCWGVAAPELHPGWDTLQSLSSRCRPARPWP